jgi:hypothetical protein
MRYIIIPLVIILYIIWSYYGIKELIKDYKFNKKYKHCNPFLDALFLTNCFWIQMHIIFIIISLLSGIAYLTFIYW